MNLSLQSLKKLALPAILIIALIVVVIFAFSSFKSSEVDEPVGQVNNSGDRNDEDASGNLQSEEGSVDEEEDELELNDYELSIYNSYDAKIAELEKGSYFKQLCPIEIEEETAENEYIVVKGCLYKNGTKVFNYGLNAYHKVGFFGADLDVRDSLDSETFYETAEWFRFENDNRLFVYLLNTAGCGGCAFNGHYLEIDSRSGEIVARYNEKRPNYFQTIISPNNTRAIVASWNNEENHRTNLFLYDFRDFSEKLVYTVPDDKSVLYVGYGTQPHDGAIAWLDNSTISVQLFEKSREEDALGEKDGVKYQLNQEGEREGIKSGPALIIKVAN